MTTFYVADTNDALEIDVQELIIAGWAGREQAGIDEHIEELSEIGVTPLSSHACSPRIGRYQLTTAETVQVLAVNPVK